MSFKFRSNETLLCYSSASELLNAHLLTMRRCKLEEITLLGSKRRVIKGLLSFSSLIKRKLMSVVKNLGLQTLSCPWRHWKFPLISTLISLTIKFCFSKACDQKPKHTHTHTHKITVHLVVKHMFRVLKTGILLCHPFHWRGVSRLCMLCNVGLCVLWNVVSQWL